VLYKQQIAQPAPSPSNTVPVFEGLVLFPSPPPVLSFFLLALCPVFLKSGESRLDFTECGRYHIAAQEFRCPLIRMKRESGL
jgi:hypothetical protein